MACGLNIPITPNILYETPYIVDNTNPAPYVTIQSAIIAANAAGGGMVIVRPSATAYAENLNFLPNVNLSSLNSEGIIAQSGSGVVVNGNCTLTDTAGTTFITIQGIQFTTTTGSPIAISASTTFCGMIVSKCSFSNNDGTDLFTCSTTGSAFVEFTATDCFFNASGQVATAGAQSGITIQTSNIDTNTNGFTLTAAELTLSYCTISVSEVAFITNGLTNLTCFYNTIECPNGGIVFNDSSGSAELGYNKWNSGGTYVFAGNGAIEYGDEIFTSVSALDPALNLTPSYSRPRATAGNSINAFAGTASFNEDDFTAVDGFVSLASDAAVNSSVATAAFGSLAVGTSQQNTLGYDILVNVSIAISSAVGATITMGVGSATGPTTNPMIASLSVATIVSFSAIVPSGYWILVNTTGTITVGSITTQVCAI